MAKTLKELIESSVNNSRLKVNRASIDRAPDQVDRMKRFVQRNYSLELGQPEVAVLNTDGGEGVLGFYWKSKDVYVSLRVYDAKSDFEIELKAEGELN